MASMGGSSSFPFILSSFPFSIYSLLSLPYLPSPLFFPCIFPGFILWHNYEYRLSRYGYCSYYSAVSWMNT